MLRDRLIFCLIYCDGFFMQSRNFRLQRVGGIQWLRENYNFQKISFSLDELVVLDASRDNRNINEFALAVKALAENVFIPISAGGGVRSLADAQTLFNSGADKIVLNSAIHLDPDLVKTLVGRFGSQSLLASIDYRLAAETRTVFIENGSTEVESEFSDYLKQAESLGVGEILLHSIDQDGTGFGYDTAAAAIYARAASLPLIMSGGAGNEAHLLEGLSISGVTAVATANLFNFIGDGLINARSHMISSGANLADWS